MTKIRILRIFACCLVMAGLSALCPSTAFSGVTSATHSVQGGVYSPGQNLVVAATISHQGDLTALGYSLTLPPGWTYLSKGGATPPAIDPLNTAGTLDFGWFSFPANPLSFTITISVPADASGPQNIVGLITYRTTGGPLQLYADPNPLQLSSQKLAQTIGPVNFNPATLAVNGQTTVAATATSGLPVAFTSATPNVCTVSGSTVTALTSGTCTIAANQAGDENYNAAGEGTGSLGVAKLNQTIGPVNFDPATLAVNGQTTVAATATSGLAVVFTSTTPNICAVSGSTVTALTSGTCSIAANQAGNENYNAAGEGTGSLGVAKINQTIGALSFNPASLAVNGQTTVAATATSGLSVVFTSTTPNICAVSGSTVTALTSGTCTIAANQAGDENYNAAGEVTGSLDVTKLNQTIGALSFNPASLAVNGQTTVAATATSGLPVAFTSATPNICTVSGSTVTGLTSGTCTIAANQAGDENYSAAGEGTGSLMVNGPPVLGAIGSRTVNEGATLSFGVSAADGDGTAPVLSYQSDRPLAGASFSGGAFTWTPTFLQAGVYTLTFKAADSLNGSLFDTETITITVANVNRPLTASAINPIATGMGTPATVEVTVDDPDQDDSHLITVKTAPVNGLVVVNADGAVTYVPRAGFSGNDGFTLTVDDQRGSAVDVNVNVSVARNPTFTDTTAGSPARYTDAASPLDTALSDLDGDGDLDMLVADGRGEIFVYLGTASGVFTLHGSFSAQGTPFSLLLADMNGDGRLDIVAALNNPAAARIAAAVETPNALAVFLGDAGLVWGSPAIIPSAETLAGAAIADVNGDGVPDVAAVGSHSLMTFLGGGNGALVEGPITALGFAPGGLLPMDVNGDGAADVLVPSRDEGTVSVMLAQNGGAFVEGQILGEGVAGGATAALADFEGDGTSELLMVDSATGGLTVFSLGANHQFAKAFEVPGLGAADNLAAADVNGDGNIDVVVSGSQGTTVLYLSGNGTVEAVDTLNITNAMADLALADLNGDGKADVIAIDTAASQVQAAGVSTGTVPSPPSNNVKPSGGGGGGGGGGGCFLSAVENGEGFEPLGLALFAALFSLPIVLGSALAKRS